jgi:hypothetical protein
MLRNISTGSWVALGLGLLLLSTGGCVCSQTNCTGARFPRLQRLLSNFESPSCKAGACRADGCESCCPGCRCCCKEGCCGNCGCGACACGGCGNCGCGNCGCGNCGCGNCASGNPPTAAPDMPREMAAPAPSWPKEMAAPVLSKPEGRTAPAPSKAEDQAAPARLPRPPEAAPLPPKAPASGVPDNGMPWPGEVPAAPKKSSDSSSDGRSPEHAADVQRAACFVPSGECVPAASGDAQLLLPQSPRLLATAANDPPSPLGPAASQTCQAAGAGIRLAIHEDSPADDLSPPRPNPLR